MTPCEEIAKTIVDRMKRSPLMPVVTSFIGSESVTEARKILKAGGIPTFPTPERAIAALASLLDRSAGRTRATVRTKISAAGVPCLPAGRRLPRRKAKLESSPNPKSKRSFLPTISLSLVRQSPKPQRKQYRLRTESAIPSSQRSARRTFFTKLISEGSLAI